METGIDVNGSMTGLRPPQTGNGVSARTGSLVKVGLFLKDTLKVLGEEGEVTMSQCCYEQKIISMYASQVDDMDQLRQLVYQALHGNMHMHPQAAEMAKAEVATTIRDLVQPTRATNTTRWTLLLEVHVECNIKKDASISGNGPSGNHGYNRLVERLDNEVCGVCHNEFTSPNDIVVTPCHHTYHRSCLFIWLYQGSYSCPICRSDVAPMVGGQISF